MIYVALLRGINVGGKNRVPMSELRDLLGSLGHEDARTYVQSGNVVFRSPAMDEALLARGITEGIAATFGLDVRVVVREGGGFSSALERHPFLADEVDPAKLHVMFLAAAPSEEAVAGLDPDRSPPDHFAVDGREVYLHYPNGAGRSKLTIDYFERRLGTTATARNWNTVLRLAAMIADAT